MVTHNPQPWITIVHVLVNGMFYFKTIILYNLDYSYIGFAIGFLFTHSNITQVFSNINKISNIF